MTNKFSPAFYINIYLGTGHIANDHYSLIRIFFLCMTRRIVPGKNYIGDRSTITVLHVFQNVKFTFAEIEHFTLQKEISTCIKGGSSLRTLRANRLYLEKRRLYLNISYFYLAYK